MAISARATVTAMGSTLLVLALGVGRVDAQAGSERYVLGFDHAFSTHRGVGGGILARHYCTLYAPERSGCQGWSFGVTVDGSPGLDARIVGITMNGTDTVAHFIGGFAVHDVTTGEGNEGAVAAVVLSFGVPSVMPPGETSTLAEISVQTTRPAPRAAYRLRYVEGLRRPGGGPTPIAMTDAGLNVPPVTEELEAPVGLLGCCDAPINLGLSTERVSSPTPFDGVLGVGALCAARDEVLQAPSPAGRSAPVAFFADLVSQLGSAGVQGWSLSIEVFGEATVSGATMRMVPRDAPSLLDGPLGFEAVGTADPALSGGRRGVVAAGILTFDSSVTLPSIGTESVLELELEGPALAVGETAGAEVWFADGLVASGEPVRNVVVVGGRNVEPCNLGHDRVRLRFAGGEVFRRGDADRNGRVTIGDVVRTLGALFASGHLPCPDAADIDDDGRVNVGDAVGTAGFLFLRGAPPAPPFPGCGIDPTSDDLVCDAVESCDPVSR